VGPVFAFSFPGVLFAPLPPSVKPLVMQRDSDRW